MAQADLQSEQAAAEPASQLEGQTYEIIRKRLSASGDELRSRLEKLNHARKQVFGSIETKLLKTERVTTENNCIPRDMVGVGKHFLFGYNVRIGLRSETVLSDVFSVYKFEEGTFHAQPLTLFEDEQFQRDFRDLYKYYRETQFAKFHLIGPHLFMVFQVGKKVTDIKTFKWAVTPEGLTYLDNRSDHEYKFPPQHEFQWQRTRREQHRTGVHPHISIDDRVFVETLGGDLTIKIENNTASGEGIYEEDVDNPDQTLDDADIQYAVIGNIILLKILPYQEKQYRYLVYNEKIQQVRRIDAIADACVLLPDDHGLIFPNGYYLQSGEYKTFDTNVSQTVFSRRISSPNGEDYLYVFHNQASGAYVLLSYNLISQEVATPNICSGYAFFEDGQQLTFRDPGEPQKHHAVQIWQTPFVGPDYVPPIETDSLLYRIGNRELVRGMAEAHEVLNLVGREDSYANLYLDLVKLTTDMVDSYFWLSSDEAFHLKDVLLELGETAKGAISEYEKVVRVRRATQDETKRVTKAAEEVMRAISLESYENISGYVRGLADLRTVRGEIISLRDLRYADLPAIDKLEESVRAENDRLAARCVEFLLQPDALKPYEERVEKNHAQIAKLTKVADAKVLQEEVDATATELEMLIEIVSNLKIDDATQRTEIIDNISAIFSKLNQSRSALKNRTQELASAEGAAEFHSQLKLLDQSVANYLDVCDSPQKCEEFLTKVMIQIEEMEGRFGEFDEFLLQVGEKRDEIYNAFESRRLALVEARNRRADTLLKSADRILKGIKTRADSFKTVGEINGYFASDLMIDKIRDLVDQLTELEDSVKVDDIQSRLKTIKEDAIRQLKDRQELYVDGQNIIQLGRHNFSVNVQALDLTTVVRNDEMCYHLTGTNFFEPIQDESLLSTRAAWNQSLVSETDAVYRAEYLAWQMLQALGTGDLPKPIEFHKLSQKEVLTLVQKFMAPRYSEGYVKGVHDHDAARLLTSLVEVQTAIGLLRYSAASRALAWLFWLHYQDPRKKPLLSARLAGFGKVQQLFPAMTTQAECIAQLEKLIQMDEDVLALIPAANLRSAATFLFHVLVAGGDFPISREASDVYHQLRERIDAQAFHEQFEASLSAVKNDVTAAFALARDWVHALVDEMENQELREYADEAALLLLEQEVPESRVVHTSVTKDLAGMVGSHAVIKEAGYKLHFNDFTTKLIHFTTVDVPRFQQYTHRKHELIEEFRHDLRLEEFQPRVLTSFVRNQLIDKVYLPLIGDNLAKQLGTAGEGKRTDRMGMLLVISPPGYGKTTLMEYVANRLGIIFMKINGPALGHSVTSLDPAEAPNASAREEVEKLNLAFEMGDNVMIYLDDIQHTHPEFLQKFISLCDAQRKIEGVYKGRTRTYDLRGKKVCVVMAGNPYTESGEKFQIPDMLSNRADTYNLGEIIGDNAGVFEMSYIENAITSNPTLARLLSRHPEDVVSVIKMAAAPDQAIELEGNYSADELGEMMAVMKKLIHVRNIVLKVNREYIRSAAQSDEYRTEPAFKLQGSYRNMNRIAERISPVMNDKELHTLVYSAYENDAQTLTSGAEANLLKFKELLGVLNETEARRWEDIKRTFQQNVRMRGIDADDKFGQVIAQMSVFSDGLSAIKHALADGVKHLAADQSEEERLNRLISELGEFRTGLDGIKDSLASGITKLTKQSGKKQAITATLDPEAMKALTTLVQQSTAAGSMLSADQKIHVVNKVPRVILGVIREQFKLMEGWMKPLVDHSAGNSAAMKDVRGKLDEALKQYREMLGELKDQE